MKSERSERRFPFSLPAVIGLAVVALALTLATLPTSAERAGAAEPEILAEVGSVDITRAEVESSLASELQRLERERHELIERGLDQAIERSLVELEAEARGVSRQELLDAVYADVAAPTDEEVDQFYEQRKSQINRAKEEVADQIRSYLQQQRRQAAYDELVGELRQRYEVASYLEPMRTEVATADAPAMGSADAPVTIIEFSDFQCPYCQRLAPTLDRITETYGDQVRLVFRQFPLPIHADAQKAAEASLCAAEQGKFWEMHDAMFANIQALSVAELKQKAGELGLDTEQFAACLDSGRFAAQVAQDLQAGREAGVTGTPAMFINGRFVSGAVPYETVAGVIDDELQRRERDAAE